MKIIEGKEKEYKDWYDKNNDGYSRACFTYADGNGVVNPAILSIK